MKAISAVLFTIFALLNPAPVIAASSTIDVVFTAKNFSTGYSDVHYVPLDTVSGSLTLTFDPSKDTIDGTLDAIDLTILDYSYSTTNTNFRFNSQYQMFWVYGSKNGRGMNSGDDDFYFSFALPSAVPPWNETGFLYSYPRHGLPRSLFFGTDDVEVELSDYSCALDWREIRDSVTVFDFRSPTMQADFIPSNRCSLEDVAEDMGYDHFNWVQVITHYDGLLLVEGFVPINLFPPFLDPPHGGYISPFHPADGFDFYWDEKYGGFLDPDYHLDNYSAENWLYFTDSPGSCQIDEPDEYMAFTTSLVGVVDGNIWIPEFTFEWESNYNPGGWFCGGRNVEIPAGGEGGIYNVRVLDDPLDVSPEVMRLWEKNGGFDSVPKSIEIDVTPSGEPNCLNVNSHGVIPVAILGSGDFEIAEIDQRSLSFGGLEVRKNGNSKLSCSSEFINEDNFPDLVCRFVDSKADWLPNDGSVTLRGKLLDGLNFAGKSTFCSVPN